MPHDRVALRACEEFPKPVHAIEACWKRQLTQRLAWFGPTRVSSVARSLSLALAAEVPALAMLDVYDEPRAAAFTAAQAARPYDLCLYEIADASPFDYVLEYLFQTPGVLIVHDPLGADAAIAASTLVLALEGAVPSLQRDHPNTPVRALPIAAAPIGDDFKPHDGDIRFAVLGGDRRDVARRAIERARGGGAHATLLTAAESQEADGASGDQPLTSALADEALVRHADVVIAMQWPATAAGVMDAALGMSAGRPVLVFETEGTATWPALDPQSWQPRGADGQDPIVVSIDPRDEEHSLMLAVRRLSGDERLRRDLGTAARAWWRGHATPTLAAAAWRALL